MKPPTRPERRALELLKECGVTSPPVDVPAVAAHLGVGLISKAFEGDISGILYRDARRKVIGVNASEPLKRRRFTIAHELGHLLLHPGKPLIIERNARINLRDARSGEGTDFEEVQANQFAAELLMPRHLLVRALADLTDTDEVAQDQIRRLARVFNVSTQAMGLRVANLGFFTI